MGSCAITRTMARTLFCLLYSKNPIKEQHGGKKMKTPDLYNLGKIARLSHMTVPGLVSDVGVDTLVDCTTNQLLSKSSLSCGNLFPILFIIMTVMKSSVCAVNQVTCSNKVPFLRHNNASLVPASALSQLARGTMGTRLCSPWKAISLSWCFSLPNITSLW